MSKRVAEALVLLAHETMPRSSTLSEMIIAAADAGTTAQEMIDAAKAAKAARDARR
jgi:hypothetical protein